MLSTLFTEPVKGIENIWIFGDSFCKNTADAFFHIEDEQTFSKKHYEVSIFCMNQQSSNMRNILARILNNVITTLNRRKYLPKMIVFLLEDDLIQYLNHNNYGATELFGKVISYLEAQLRDTLYTFKSLLPTKAKKHNWPQMIWIPPANHNKKPKGLKQIATLPMPYKCHTHILI